MSHFQIYVCDLDGSHRRLVTRAKVDCTDVRWLGTERLTFVEGGKRLLQLNLQSGKRRLLASGHPVRGYGERVGHERRGVPQYLIGDEPYQVSFQGLARAQDSRPVRGQRFLLESPDPVHPGRLVYDPNTSKGILYLNGRPIIVIGGAADNEELEDAFATKAGGCYIVTNIGNSTLGETHVLWALDWRAGRAGPVAFGHDLDFAIGKRTWASVSIRRYGEYGKTKAVWVSEATVHNRETGHGHTLVSGLQYADSISISPLAP